VFRPPKFIVNVTARSTVTTIYNSGYKGYSRLWVTSLWYIVLVLLALMRLMILRSRWPSLLRILLPPLVREVEEMGYWGLGKRHRS